MSGAALTLRLARRELRGGWRGFGVFIACLALGVAAIAAVGVVNAGIIEALRQDARVLLGGDVSLEGSIPPIEEELVAEITPAGGAYARTLRTNTSLIGPDGQRMVARLKAVSDTYPLYGTVELAPAMPLDEALSDNGIVMERGGISRMGLELGDMIRVGNGEFTLRAALVSEPDQLGGGFAFGPRAIVDYRDLAETGLIQIGSLARTSDRIRLPADMDTATFLRDVQANYADSPFRARGVEDIQPSVTRFTDRLASYLTLAGMATLLVGGLGVALATQNYLAAKTRHIAMLKCLGGENSLIYRVYLLQILILAGVGVVIGVILGQILPYFTRYIPTGALPVRVELGFYPLPLLLAALCGLLTAMAFALWPLATAKRITPAGLFRQLIAGERRLPDRMTLGLMFLTFAVLAVVAIISVAKPVLGAAFVGVALVAGLALALLANTILRGLSALGRRFSGLTRLAASNLKRPGSGAVSVIVALGAGLTVLMVVALLQYNLAREINQQLPNRAPAFFFIDIQPSQLERFRAIIAETPDGEVLDEAPMLRGRVARIDGQPVDEVEIGDGEEWTVRQDRGITWRATPPPDARIIAGEWWPEDYAGPLLVSVDEEVAVAYGVGIGDTLTFNVLGRNLTAEIANLRYLEWEDGGIEFLFMFSPSGISDAPHQVIATADVPEEQEPALLRRMTEELPNVTPISIRQVAANLGEALGKIAVAIQLVGAVTLVAGVFVLAGAVAAARRRHLYESVVLKVLGAQRADLLRVFLLEYTGLGLAAVAIGALVGTAGAYIVVTQVMELTWQFSWIALLIVGSLSLALTLSAGFLGTWRMLGRTAASVLREA